MKNWAGDILDVINNSFDLINFKGLKICEVKTVSPLVFTYDGVDIGSCFNDTVYIHPLMTYSLIELDENSLSSIQGFENSTAYNSPTFEASISGSIPDFIKNFYTFFKKWQSVYNLSEGDLIAVWELEDNGFLVLNKIALDIYEENKEDEK